MDSIILQLPSPSQALRLALSSLNSVLSYYYREPNTRRALLDFDIDAKTGFIPPQPLPRLLGPFELWERALAMANQVIRLGDDECKESVELWPAGQAWRTEIISWPVLDTEVLHGDLRKLQRAHMVLAWLLHFFVHSIPVNGQKGPILVPKSLSIPLVGVSRVLGIAPVLCYVDSVVWNWELVDPCQPASMHNIRPVNLFSRTEDERGFYTGSAAAEFKAGEALQIIDEYHNLPNVTSLAAISKVARGLTRLAVIIDEISEKIQSIRPNCDPHVFYWEIRPWYNGSSGEGNSRSSWIYEGIEDTDKLDLSGPSQGQSTALHAIDVFLDIDHKLQQKRLPAPTDRNKKADTGFMQRMRRYMPGPHREYLEYLEDNPRPVRELALSTPALREPYNAAVMALKRLRDAHMRIACLYIVTMSKTTPSKSGCPVAVMLNKLQKQEAEGKGPVRGTGGTELSTLLKAGRDATRRSLLE